MKYENMPPIGRDEAHIELESGVPERVARALVRVAIHDSDRAFVEDTLAVHLESPDAWIRGVAATCAGHVARIHRALDTARLVPLIERLGADARTRERMEDALEDIEMFIGKYRERS